MKVQNPNELLYKPFNAEMHKDNFICYCEVIIHKDGLIEYAVPSHQEKLIQIYADKHLMSRDNAMDFLRQQQEDPIDLMMCDTGCIYIWYDHMHNATNLTDAQMHALTLLLNNTCICDAVLNDMQDYGSFGNAIELRKANMKKSFTK